jgi:hypothetical protein
MYHYKYTRLMGLIISCPFGKSDINCPFNVIRGKPILERLEIIENMDPTELQKIEKYHLNCSKNRENNIEM